MKKLIFLILTILIISAGQSPSKFPGPSNTPMRVQEPINLVTAPSAVPSPYSQSVGGQISIGYELNYNSDIRIEISNFNEVVKRILITAGQEGGRIGRNSVLWSAQKSDGKPLIPGVYFVKIFSSSENRFLGKADIFVLN